MHTMEYVPISQIGNKSMMNKVKKLTNKNYKDESNKVNYNGDMFVPDCGLVNYLIDNAVNLKMKSKTRSFAGCKLLEHRSKKSTIKCGTEFDFFIAMHKVGIKC